jgi:hypothetical protein
MVYEVIAMTTLVCMVGARGAALACMVIVKNIQLCMAGAGEAMAWLVTVIMSQGMAFLASTPPVVVA